MHTATTARRLPMLAASMALLAACSDAGTSSDPVDLGSVDSEATTDAGSETAEESTPGAGEGQAQGTEEEAASDDTDPSGLVDTTEAVPGTWPVGDAGTVTFTIVDGALALDDVSAASGWQAEIDEQDRDEIEVDFRRGEIEWEIEIELKEGGTILGIEIDLDIENAQTGSYDIGDAGTFAFSVAEGRLVLDDLNITEGWTLTALDEQADEIEFEVLNGPREFDVEIELEDDGSIELEIDYEVVGPVTG